MKKIIIIFFVLLMILTMMITASSVKLFPVDTTKTKLIAYANSNIKDSLKYSSFEIGNVENFGDYIIINVKINGKDARWFKATKDFNRITK